MRVSWASAVGVGAVALGLRLAYWLVLTPDQVLRSDASQYHTLGANLAAGLGYVDTYPQLELHATAFRPPLFPFVLSIAYRIVDPTPGVGRALNVLIGTAVTVAVSALVTRHASRPAGIAAGLAVAIAPNLIANDTTVVSEPLGMLLLVGLVAALLADRWGLAALLTGLGMLTRPSAQYLVVPLAVWVGLRLGWRDALRYGSLSVLVVVPWVLRNDARLGAPVLVTSTGYNWAARYSPAAQTAGGFVDPIFDVAFTDSRFYQFDEAAWSDHLTDIGRENLRANPELLPLTAARNGADLFELRPGHNEPAERSDGRHLGARRATLGIFYATLLAGAVGLWRTRRAPDPDGAPAVALARLATLIAAYFVAASLVFMAVPRLRAPVDVVLAIGVGLLLHDRTRRSRARTSTEERAVAQ